LLERCITGSEVLNPANADRGTRKSAGLADDVQPGCNRPDLSQVSDCVFVEVGGTKDGKRIPSGALYVHTLAIDGNETEATMAASVELARVMKEVGTPDPVLAKLLLTGTRDGKRLDARDLKSWDNTVLVPFHGSELR